MVATMKQSSSSPRSFPKRVRRRLRIHHRSVLALLFLAAASPSIFFATLHYQKISLQQAQSLRGLVEQKHAHGQNYLLPNLIGLQSTEATATNGRSLTVTMTATESPKQLEGRTPAALQENNQSCTVAMYISRKDVDSAVIRKGRQQRNDKASSVVQRYLMAGNVKKGSSIVLFTDDEYVLKEIDQKYRLTYEWTVLDHQPMVANFLTSITDVQKAVMCHTVIHGATESNRFLQFLLRTLKVSGRKFETIHVEAVVEKEGIPNKSSTTKPRTKVKLLKNEMRSKVGLWPCRFFSGNRQGLCDRWFQ
jgi:hypothetical protein